MKKVTRFTFVFFVFGLMTSTLHAQDFEAAAQKLRALGIDASEARLYPAYASDYAATFFEDPDGIRLEVTNYRQERRDRHDRWNELH